MQGFRSHSLFLSLFLTSLWGLFQPLNSAAVQLNADVGLSSASYALEQGLETRLDLSLGLHSDQRLEATPLWAWDLELKAFFEARAEGDKSIDSGDLVWRKAVGEPGNGHLWLGRVHPGREAYGPGLREDKDYRRIKEWSHLDALGANWVQNQSNALSPDVKGWLGAGFHHRVGKHWSLTAAYSHVYLPTFGPTLALSEDEAPKGSRFARFPPLWVSVNDVLVPTRFNINVGDLKDIIFQPQAFVALSSVTTWSEYQIMAWSAPAPAPAVDSSGVLDVSSEEGVNVMILANPRFERENFLGARFRLRQFYVQPELAAAYELRSRRMTVSGAIRALKFLRTGFLHTFRVEDPDPQVEAVHYDDRLAWVELGPKAQLLSLRPSLRWEHHFTPGKEGNWLRPMMEYFPSERVRLFARLDLLAGPDKSYFGTWRSLDSFSLGAVLQW